MISVRRTDLLEMAKVGVMEKNNIEIIVRSNDAGKIPHFHFFDRNKKFRNEGCIRIDKAEYFSHGSKNLKMNSSQRKELVEFLKLDHGGFFNGNNWQFIVQMWNDNNSDVKLDYNLSMPDYRLLD